MFLVTKEFVKDLKEADRATIGRDTNGQGWIRITFADTVRGKKVETTKSYLVDASYNPSYGIGKPDCSFDLRSRY